MAILRSDDGVQFVVQPYRELLALKNNSLLKKELQLLGESHGNYARIFKLENNTFEAIFARDPAYLLGEAIWRHLGKPKDLLYCEALPEKDQALIVVVRDNMVYLDIVVTYNKLIEELRFLLAEKIAFAVYVYGDVPLSEQAEANNFSLAPTQIKSFTHLHTPLYTTIMPDLALRLLPIDRAIAELKLDRQKQVITAVIAAFILIFLLIGWWSTRPAPTPQQQAVANPYLAYQIALQTPGADVQLKDLAKQIITAYNIPGWIPTQVTYNNGSAQFVLHSLGSPLNTLMQWAVSRGLTVNFTSNGADLNLYSSLPGRVAPTTISPLQPILAKVVDRMMQIIPGKSVQIGTTKSSRLYRETSLTITLTNMSPEILNLAGQALTNLPVNLTGATFVLNNGLLTGTIQLTVLGN